MLGRARVDVAEEAVLGAVHADVDHGRAGLHHVGADHVQLPDGGDEDVGVERVPLEVDGARVADRHGRVRLEQQCAIGLPTMLERPTTTARAPSVSMRYSASMRMIPSGVPGTSFGRPR